METIHNELRSKLSWYDRWHAHAHSSAVTWGIFLVVSVLMLLVILENIDRYVALIAVDTQMSAVSSVTKQKTTHTKENEKVLRVRTLTNDALKNAEAHARGASADMQTTMTELKRILTERKKAILDVVQSNPESLKGLLLDEVGVASFPLEVRSLLEKPFKESGTYKIALVTTLDPGEGKLLSTHEEGYEEYFLVTGDGEKYTLALTQQEAYSLSPETPVTVTGVDIGSDIVVPTEEFIAGDSDGDGEVLGASTVKRVAIIAFNFSNNTAAPLTALQIKERVFTGTKSVRTYMNEVSYGQWDIQGVSSVDGDVFDWVTIPLDANGSCNYTGWATEANAMLVNAGVNLSGYTNIQYVFPGLNTGCAWSGLAHLSGSTTWVKAESLGAYVSGHELSHNFGFHHSGKYNCTVATNSSPSTCISNEYGDPYDIMGSSAKHTNTYNKAKYWLSPGQMQTVTQSGTYALEALEVTTGGVKFLRMKRPFTSSLGSYTDGYYQVEFRTPLGEFGNTSTGEVIVRLVDNYTTSNGKKTFYVRTLAQDSPLVDVEAGVTISFESVSTTGAQIKVTFNTPICVRNNPSVTANPTGAWVAAGVQASYAVTVTNNDSAGCAPASFTITPTLPNGFTQSPNPLSVTLQPQGQNVATLNILSSLGTVAGTYPITVRVSNDASQINFTESLVNYNVVATDSIAPLVTITQPSEGARVAGRKANVTVSATDTSGIAKIDVVIDGVTVKTCSLTASCLFVWSLSKVGAGTHTVEGVALDNSALQNKGQAKVTVTK